MLLRRVNRLWLARDATGAHLDAACNMRFPACACAHDASRLSALPMLMCFLAPLFLCELIRKRAKAAEAAAFLDACDAGRGGDPVV